MRADDYEAIGLVIANAARRQNGTPLRLPRMVAIPMTGSDAIQLCGVLWLALAGAQPRNEPHRYG